MLSLTTSQNNQIAATAAKKIAWLFEITPLGQTTLYWSTQGYAWSVNPTHPYLFAIHPESFAGVKMYRSKHEAGVIPMPTADFVVTNNLNPYDAEYFTDATVIIRLVINEVEIRSWKMVVVTCTPGYKSLAFECEGFLKQYLRGSFPRWEKVVEIYPKYTGDKDDCAPQIYGVAYIPLPCTFYDGGNTRGYLLGLDGTYTVTAVHAGADWDAKTSEWLASTGYHMDQVTGSSADWDYNFLRPLVSPIYSPLPDLVDYNTDFAVPFAPGGQYPPLCAQYTLANTVSLTNPADVIHHALQHLGVPSGDIDDDSLAAAATIFSAAGITWNGGISRKRNAEAFLCQLLAECHAEIDVRDKVYLRSCEAAWAATLPIVSPANVMRRGNTSSWGYTLQLPSEYDSGHLSYSETGTPDDVRIHATISVDDTALAPMSSLDLSFVHDSVIAQKLALAYHQRQKMVIGQPKWDAPLLWCKYQPGDMLSVDSAVDGDDYGAAGGSYQIMIDEMQITKEGTVHFDGLRFHRLDRWAAMTGFVDITPAAEGEPEPTILPKHIADIHNPNILTRAELMAIKGDFDGFTAEKTALDAKAAALGIVGEKAAYDAAYTALHEVPVDYGGLGPYHLGDILATQGFAIAYDVDGDVYRTAWTAYKSARMVLLNALDAKTAKSNQVASGTFDLSLGVGSWVNASGSASALSIVAVTGQTFGKALRVAERDIYEDSVHWCEPGEYHYASAWINTTNTTHAVSFGVCFFDATGAATGWVKATTLPAATTWTQCVGVFQAPAGAVFWRPWIFIDATDTFGTADLAGLYIGNHELAATYGADYDANVANTPDGLADINPDEGAKLAGVEAGADNTATKLATAGALVLKGTITPTDSGSVKCGTITWNSETGVWVSGAGVAITPFGIVGASSSGVTFTLNAATGEATYAGPVTAGSFTTANVLGSSYSGVHIHSDSISPLFIINWSPSKTVCVLFCPTSSSGATALLTLNASTQHHYTEITYDENDNPIYTEVWGPGKALSTTGMVSHKDNAGVDVVVVDGATGATAMKELAVAEAFGCNGAAAQAAATASADATDLATAITLVNNLKAILIANGIAA